LAKGYTAKLTKAVQEAGASRMINERHKMRAFKIACIVYCALYLIMTFIATWDIQHSMTRDFLAWKANRKHWDPGFPTFHVQADATLVPFIIKVKHSASLAPLAGRGYTSYYFWFFGFKKVLSERQTMVS